MSVSSKVEVFPWLTGTALAAKTAVMASYLGQGPIKCVSCKWLAFLRVTATDAHCD